MATPQISDETKLSLAAETLQTFGELRFAALGSSMIPAIFPGDILIVRREPAAAISCGDVALSFAEERLRAHRVVRRMEDGGRLTFVTQGDALSEGDRPIGEAELLGRVTAIIRRRRRIELDRRPGAWRATAQWAVRNSSAAAKWLLRWHSVQTRLSRTADLAVAPGVRNFAGQM